MALSSVTINMGDWWSLNSGNISAIQSKMDTLLQWCSDCNIGKSNDGPIMVQFNSLMTDINSGATYAINEQVVLAITIPLLQSKGLKYALSLSSGGRIFDPINGIDQINGPWWDSTANFTSAYAELQAKVDWYYSKGYATSGNVDNVWYLNDVWFHNWFATNKPRTDNIKTYEINVLQKLYTKKGGLPTTGTMYLYIPMGLTWLNDYSYADATANTNMAGWINSVYSGIAARKVKIYICSDDQVAGSGFGYPGALGAPSDFIPGGSFYTQALAKLTNIYNTITGSSSSTKIFPKVMVDLTGLTNWPTDTYPYSASFSRVKSQLDNEDQYSTLGCGPAWVTGDAMWSGFNDSTMRTDYKAYYFSAPIETITTPVSAPTGQASAVKATSYDYTSCTTASNPAGHSLQYQFDWKGDGTDLSGWGNITQSKLWSTTGSFSVKSQARDAVNTTIISGWSPALSVTVSATETGNYAWANTLGTWTLESKTPKYEIDQTSLITADWASLQTQLLNEDVYSSDHLVAGNLNNTSQGLFSQYHSYYLSAGTPSSWIPLNIKATLTDYTKFFSCEGIHVLGNYLYFLGRGSGTTGWFNVVDMTTPTNPVLLGGSIEDANFLWAENCDAVTIGSKIYAFTPAYSANYFSVVDVTNPANPIKAAEMTCADFDGSLWANVSGNYCFVSNYGKANFTNNSRSVPGKIVTIDISNPLAPTKVGNTLSSMNLAGMETTILVGSHLYCACHYYDTGIGGMVIVDVSDPLNPAIVGAFSSAKLFGCEGIAVEGNYAYICGMYDATGQSAPYVSNTTGTLQIVDITNSSSPVGKGYVQDATYLKKAHEVIVYGNYAYVCALGDSRVTVVDISDKDNPIIKDSKKDNTYMNSVARILEYKGYLIVSAPGSNGLAVLGQ